MPGTNSSPDDTVIVVTCTTSQYDRRAGTTGAARA